MVLATETQAAAVAAEVAVAAMKTSAATVMVGAETTINNQLKAEAIMATKMATVIGMRTTTTMMAMAVVGAVGGGGNRKAGLLPLLSTNVQTICRDAAPRVDKLATFGVK